VNAARAYARELGFEIVLEGYASDDRLSAIINKMEAAELQVAGRRPCCRHHHTDSPALEAGISLQYVALLVAPPEPAFAELGDAALGIIGPSQWEPTVGYSAEGAESMGIEWYGPTVQEFVDAYTAKYNEEPSYHSAGGYIAGPVLEKALLDAGSTDPEAVKAALDAMNILTFFGHTQFDTSEESHGLQIGHSMVYIQWQEEAGNLVKHVVWPAEAAEAETMYPISGE
jgi:branched-chain amino acid transport system substrate-binding protein